MILLRRGDNKSLVALDVSRDGARIIAGKGPLLNRGTSWRQKGSPIGTALGGV